MSLPGNLKYTKDHEWVRVEGDKAIVGITDFAQNELGELVFVDLPQVGKSVAQKDTLCVVESTKAASDVYSPVSGTVAEVNSELSNTPDLINKAPYEGGWIAKLSGFNASEIGSLMDATQYQAFLGNKA